MKYHALFVIFENAAKFKLSSAANKRRRFPQFIIEFQINENVIKLKGIFYESVVTCDIL